MECLLSSASNMQLDRRHNGILINVHIMVFKIYVVHFLPAEWYLHLSCRLNSVSTASETS